MSLLINDKASSIVDKVLRNGSYSDAHELVYSMRHSCHGNDADTDTPIITMITDVYAINKVSATPICNKMTLCSNKRHHSLQQHHQHHTIATVSPALNPWMYTNPPLMSTIGNTYIITFILECSSLPLEAINIMRRIAQQTPSWQIMQLPRSFRSRVKPCHAQCHPYFLLLQMRHGL